MNWKEADNKIRIFSSSFNKEAGMHDTGFVGGKSSEYYIWEGNFILYDFRIAKPVPEYGSRLRILSELNGNEIRIISSPRLLGKPNVQIRGSVDEETRNMIDELASDLDKFAWVSGQRAAPIPVEFHNKQVLEFTTRKIEPAIDAIDQIREIHKRLTHLV